MPSSARTSTGERYDVIIIGAGISGLYAAYKLSHGHKVLVIESRNRVGGRIHTAINEGFTRPAEEGAEFIHGTAKLTHELMKRCGANSFSGKSRAWTIYNRKLFRDKMFPNDLLPVVKALDRIREDTTMVSFLKSNFQGTKFNALREDVTRMVQGFDAADADKISAFAVRDEWKEPGEIPGARPSGGYSQLTDWLFRESQKKDVEFIFSSDVREIRWKKGNAMVVLAGGERFSAKKTIITVSLGVLKNNHIRFIPRLPDHEKAFSKMEMGDVIKFLVEFKSRIWEKRKFRIFKNLSFLFSDADIPTWWTQSPDRSPVLTGWFSGPPVKVEKWKTSDLINMALSSLSYLFSGQPDEIRNQIRAIKVIDWSSDPYSMGAYAYKTVESASAIKTISTPVKSTLFFAGEAFHEGVDMGTVEAALKSAARAVKMAGR